MEQLDEEEKESVSIVASVKSREEFCFPFANDSAFVMHITLKDLVLLARKQPRGGVFPLYVTEFLPRVALLF